MAGRLQRQERGLAAVDGHAVPLGDGTTLEADTPERLGRGHDFRAQPFRGTERGGGVVGVGVGEADGLDRTVPGTLHERLHVRVVVRARVDDGEPSFAHQVRPGAVQRQRARIGGDHDAEPRAEDPRFGAQPSSRPASAAAS